MSDIVDELRAIVDPDYGDVAADSVYGSAMVRAADEIDRLRAALREFCNRVEKGEIKSTQTYAKFKALLGEKV